MPMWFDLLKLDIKRNISTPKVLMGIISKHFHIFIFYSHCLTLLKLSEISKILEISLKIMSLNLMLFKVNQFLNTIAQVSYEVIQIQIFIIHPHL